MDIEVCDGMDIKKNENKLKNYLGTQEVQRILNYYEVLHTGWLAGRLLAWIGSGVCGGRVGY